MFPLARLLLTLAPSSGQEGALVALEREIVGVVERVRPVVASIDVDRDFPLGPVSLSGFALDAKGSVVTLGGALEGARRISVRFADGRPHRGVLLGTGPGERVGLIRVEAGDLPEPPLGDSDPLRPGSIVVAVGNPFGLQSSVFFGCVSGVDRTIARFTGLLQTTVPVNRGQTGGALANSRGEIVGMLVGSYEEPRARSLRLLPAEPSRVGGAGGDERQIARIRVPSVGDSSPARSEGVHFALPLRRLREEARAVLEKEGRAAPPDEARRWLGVYFDEALDPALRSQLGLEQGRGALIREVYRGSPAARAGIEAYDVLVSIDGAPVGSVAEVRARIDAKAQGDRVALGVIRRGGAREILVLLE